MQERMKYIDRIREFNRFYTVMLGILDKTFVGTHSLAETRILYELETYPGCSAVDIAEKLRLNKGYLSRILKKFEKDGLLERQTSETDGRAYLLYLTAEGHQEAQSLIQITNEQIAEQLQEYDDDVCSRICEAMDLIEHYFQKEGIEHE